MFVYQDGKIYVQRADKLVWVEINPDQTFTVTNESAEQLPTARLLTAFEFKCKFNVTDEKLVEEKIEVVEVEEKVEVVKDVTVTNTKKPTRKSTAK